MNGNANVCSVWARTSSFQTFATVQPSWIAFSRHDCSLPRVPASKALWLYAARDVFLFLSACSLSLTPNFSWVLVPLRVGTTVSTVFDPGSGWKPLKRLGRLSAFGHPVKTGC